MNDVWTFGPELSNMAKMQWHLPLNHSWLRHNASDGQGQTPPHGWFCVPVLQHVFPRVSWHHAEVKRFVSVAALSPSPVVLTFGLFHDVSAN